MTGPDALASYLELWTDWPILELTARAALLTAVAVLLDRIWGDSLRAAWRLGFDRRRRLSYTVPLLRILLLVVVPLGTLNALRMANPMAAVVIAAATIGAATILATDHLRDMIGGLTLAITRPFRIGDVVRTGTVTGRVEAITLSRCVLRARGGEVIRVPNRDLARAALRVAPRGAALPTDVEVRLPPDLDTPLALSALRDQVYLSAFTDAAAPVVVEILGDRRARIRATPIRPEEATELASDLIARSEVLLSR